MTDQDLRAQLLVDSYLRGETSLTDLTVLVTSELEHLTSAPGSLASRLAHTVLGLWTELDSGIIDEEELRKELSKIIDEVKPQISR